MKLKSLILPTLAIALLGSSCSMFHDDLEPCKQKVNIDLSFTHNMQGIDKYDSEVHCAQVLLYDGEGNLYGQYPYDPTGKLSLMLPPGDYHAIAYGGASCADTDVDFNVSLDSKHHYTSLETSVKGSRAAEVAKDLHSHFHAMGDFSVQGLDYGEVNHSMDLVKNTNRIDVELRYTDGRKISGSNFKVYLTADNAVTDHANNIVSLGEDVIYRPFDIGSRQSDTEINGVKPWLSVFKLSTNRLVPEVDMKVHIERAAWPEVFEVIDLNKYLEQLHKKELGNYAYADYLDRQDYYLIEAEIEPDVDKLTIVSLKINNWTMVLNNFDF